MTNDLRTADEFTPDEQAALERYCTNTDSRCFALTNLPEIVKGALFARYSRSPKSLRRLLLDEFGAKPPTNGTGAADPGDTDTARAEALYEKILGQYGDDSVAQLGSAHVACEGVSNVMTKILERGRLMSYLEQSTRYIPYTDRPNGRWRYLTPPELRGDLCASYEAAMNNLFETYTQWIDRAVEHFARKHPRKGDEPEAAWRRALRAKALDTLRGLLPAATISHVGIHGSGQAFETLLLRLHAHELREARTFGSAMLRELRQVIPAFVQRVDRADRGGAWINYLKARRHLERDTLETLEEPPDGPESRISPTIRLIDHEPLAERDVLAALMYPHSGASLADLRNDIARDLSNQQVEDALIRAAGNRENRRHRPGRALEHAQYTFEITGDYGAFRDLQRHRMLTMEWQALSTDHGAVRPDEIHEMGASAEWSVALDQAHRVHRQIRAEEGPLVAQYAVPMAFRVRFAMRLNAREAMHMLELRTQPQGHPSYRRVCQEMHRLIRHEAKHGGIAAMMSHVNHDGVDLERRAAEKRTEERRTADAH